MRHVSTRGETAGLDFAEVMLAGLARDGGLYVPEAWPKLDRAAIAGFAGRPYAEVAFEVIRLFTGDAIAEADLARMVREAYGTFRHRRWPRSASSTPTPSRSSFFTARRSPSRTWRCSSWRG